MNLAFRKHISNTETKVSLLLCLTFNSVLTAPLCNLMFHCGCTWPWAGLSTYCNIHNHHALYQCPWCYSLVNGVLAVALSLFTGIWATTFLSVQNITGLNSKNITIFFKTLFGVLVFSLFALTSGWISALLQQYPHFLVFSLI